MKIEFDNKECRNCRFHTEHYSRKKGPCDGCYFRGNFEPSTELLLKIIMEMNSEINQLKN